MANKLILLTDDNNNNHDGSVMDIAVTMTYILITMVAIVIGIVSIQSPLDTVDKNNNNNIDNDDKNKKVLENVTRSTFLPDRMKDPSKYSYEIFVAYYTPIWIFMFGIVVIFQLYEQFTAITYSIFCGGLALPLLLQPIIFPSGLTNSPDQYRTVFERYSMKANIWIGIYSFIGNYWYTHYFYSVLKASYTMPSHRFNNVPIAMFFATHFYFSTYHFFSNCLLRKICTTYRPGIVRTILFVTTVIVFSYFTAFMETLTISSYPYYTFEDRYVAYTVGSAFYGIYFLISFPAFYYFDSSIDCFTKTKTTTTNTSNHDNIQSTGGACTILDTVVSSCGYGMIIMFLLDFVRLYLDIPLVVGTSMLQCTHKNI